MIATVRAVIRQHLPPGYVETMNWGMLAYEVPLVRYPGTYNGDARIAAAEQSHAGNR
ncbi:MAG TPA: hypothetical protein VGM67_04965 [Gemmatimonadaceae bacterium]